MQPGIRNAIARIDIMQQGKSLSRGTGALVADGLVLTALHVVADRTQQSLTPYPGEIVLTFPGGPVKAAIHENYYDRMADWVLLRCETPAAVLPLPLAELRDDGAAWETYGFPDANPRDGMVNIGEVSNRLGTLEGNPVFQLFSREAAAGQGAPVKGLSGSPVIVQNAVVGLLRFALMKDGQTVAGTVYACPIASVLEKAGTLLPLPDPCYGLPGLPRQPLPTEPFRHLAWFTAKEAEVFFGRNREVRQMYDRLTADDAPPMVLLYGQSGVGKSSFLDAGLLPRLRWYRQVCYLRRDARSTLLRTLRDSLDLLGGADAQAAGSLAGGWQAVEKQGGKPLVIFLDQMEEVYTHPNPRFPNELEEFCQQVAKLFDGAIPVRGKLVLSFRKEWFPEIQKQVENNGLSYGKLFLEGLDRAAVMEAIAGPTRTERLRQFYGLTVEPNLLGLIADDLLADRDSPIAPTLQILLTKMWSRAVAQSRSAPAMTVELYQSLKKEGVLLGDFLDQQLQALRPVRAEWLESGLALDLLAYHTTNLLTARECGLDELLVRYKHRAADIPALIQELENLFLLSDTSREISGDGGQKATRLCHDTLAPLVRQRYATSENPGQRARRIIESRVDDWQEGSDVGLLDAGSLREVERGAAGMRLLNAKEQKLIEASALLEHKRRRTRQMLRAGAAAGVALILAIAVYATIQRGNASEQEKLAKMQLALNNSGRVLTANPVGGLVLAVAAVSRAVELKEEIKNGQLDPKVQSALDTALNASLEESVMENAPATAIAWSPDNILALFKPIGVKTPQPYQVEFPLEFWNGTGKQLLRTIVATADAAESLNFLTAFSPDGKVIAQGMGKIDLWDQEGKLLAGPFGPKAHVLALAFAPDGKSIVTGSDDNYLRSWDLTGAMQWEKPVISTRPGADRKAIGREVVAVAAAKAPNGGVILITGGADDAVHFWTGAGVPMGVVQQYGESISTLAIVYRGDGSARFVSGGADGAMVLFGSAALSPASGESAEKLWKGKYDSNVCYAVFNPQGTVFAAAFGDGIVRIFDAEKGAEIFPDYRVDVGGCTSLAFDSSGFRLAVSDAQHVHFLNLERANLISVLAAKPGEAITMIQWSPKGDRIAAGGEQGWFYLADPKSSTVRRIDNAAVGNSTLPPVVTALRFSRDGSLLATAVSGGGAAQAIRLWDTGGKLSRELSQRSVADRIPSADRTRTADRSRSADRSPSADRNPPADRSPSADRNPPADRTLSADRTQATDRISSADRTPAANRGGFDEITHLAFTKDGRYLLSAAAGGAVTVWDLQGQGSRTLSLDAPAPGDLQALGREFWPMVAFSPDGNSIATYFARPGTKTPPEIRLWGLDGKPVGEPLKVDGIVRAIAFSPNKDSLFVWNQSGMVRWHLDTGKLVTKISSGSLASVPYLHAALSPDHQTLFSGGANIGAWSTVTGEAITEFTGNPGGTLALDVSPDGTTLASGGADGAIRLWRAQWQQWLQAACAQLNGHSDLIKSPAAEATKTAAPRDSKLLKANATLGQENIQYAARACQDKIRESKESK